MIVCSLPRCGGTKFCLDLQEQTGLQFVGELHPAHIGNDDKSSTHETGHQTNFTKDTFADTLHDHSDKIVLVNQHSYLLAPQADFFILRRNMRDASLSLANYMLKLFPKIKPGTLTFNVALSHNDQTALMAYLNKYQKEVIWFEDYYGTSGTQTPLLDAYHGKEFVLREINSYYGSTN